MTMTADEYRQAMEKLVHIAKLIAQVDVEPIRHTIERTHAVAPIVDPTAYARSMKDLEQQSVVVAAIAAAQRELQRDPALHAMLQAAPAFDRFVQRTLQQVAEGLDVAPDAAQ